MSSMAWKSMASKLVGNLTDARNRLYDLHVLKGEKVDCPVVSIGNLTVGGTGKTPVTLVLADFFIKEKKQVGIISRNYKAKAKKMVKVDASLADGAAFFGDEPFLLAKSRSELAVFVGPRKGKTAAWALKTNPSLDLLLIDDGFQHRALYRDLDIVLIDATDSDFFEPFPLGRGRERRQSLERAQWILITKANWVDQENLNWIYSLLPDDIPVTEVDFHSEWPSVEGAEGVGLFAGIARPEVFFDLARKKYFDKVRGTWAFADHQVYGPAELEKLKRFLAADSTRLLVTTEKDAIKILDPELISRIKVAPLKLEFQQGEKFFERLRSLVF